MTITGWAAFWLGFAAVIIALGLFSAIENIFKYWIVTRCINKTVKRITDSNISQEQLNKIINSLCED